METEDSGIIVKVKCQGNIMRIRIKSPETKTVNMFIEDMIKVLGWPTANNNQVPYEYNIGRKNGVPFNYLSNIKSGKILMKDFDLVAEEELIFFATMFPI